MLAAFALILATALPQPAPPFVQDPGSGSALQEHPRHDPLKRFEGLNLSQDQKDRLRNIFAKGAPHQNVDRRERHKAVMSVLTHEQRRKLREQRRNSTPRPTVP